MPKQAIPSIFKKFRVSYMPPPERVTTMQIETNVGYVLLQAIEAIEQYYNEDHIVIEKRNDKGRWVPASKADLD